jgi:hypothetical protein
MHARMYVRTCMYVYMYAVHVPVQTVGPTAIIYLCVYVCTDMIHAFHKTRFADNCKAMEQVKGKFLRIGAKWVELAVDFFFLCMP